MNDENSKKAIDRISERFIQSTSAKPGGKQALRFALNAAGSVPIVGGAIAGVGGLWSERDQDKFNKDLCEWIMSADIDIKKLMEQVNSLLGDVTPVSMALLIGEIVGDEVANQLFTNLPMEIGVILNPSTVSELEPYIAKGWIKIRSTGSLCTMGAGNRLGGYIEDLKRPYGMGNSYVLSFDSLPENV